MTTPCRESVSLGAYLLGALDPQERVAMEAHIRGCPQCTRELLELAPLPGLLRHTPFEELPQSAEAAESLSRVREQPPLLPDPPAEPVPAAATVPAPAAATAGPTAGPTAAAAESRGPFGSRRGRLAVAAAALAAVVAGSVVYAEVDRPRPAATVAAATWSATDASTHVSATADVTPEVWGTEFQLKLVGLPSNITCRLVVDGSGGRSETAGAWGSGYSAAVWIPASTSISPSQITGLDVMSSTGTLLVHVPAG